MAAFGYIARSDQPFSTSGVGSKADIGGLLLTQFSFVSTRPGAGFVLVAPAAPARAPQRPFQFGGRFSRKARMPSARSSVAKARARMRRSSFRPAARFVS